MGGLGGMADRFCRCKVGSVIKVLSRLLPSEHRTAWAQVRDAAEEKKKKEKIGLQPGFKSKARPRWRAAQQEREVDSQGSQQKASR